MKRELLMSLLALGLISSSAGAAEICGNGIDDDGDSLLDEGCAPTAVTGVCESPLSCGETGMISPSTGALQYSLPPDVNPRVPYGPGIGLRRFYTSKYDPGVGAPAWKKPLGDRWQHTYMTWLSQTGSGVGSTIALHTTGGQDVLFKFDHSNAFLHEYFTPQSGYHVKELRHVPGFSGGYDLTLLTGEKLKYDNTGRLTQIATPNSNAVTLTYDGSGQVSTVMDAQGSRRLLFSYTSSLLSTVQFQIKISSVWTTQHTTTYGYTSGVLTSATIGGQLAQANSYTSSYLTQIQDGGGKSIVSFVYSSSSAGTVVRSDTLSGMIGVELASARAACSGKTVVYFNRGNNLSCNVDADCGSGFLCGGKTGAGSTGQCFRGARCLTLSSPSEDVVTTVAPLGPPSETCDGACTDIAQYVWNTGAGILDLKAIQDPVGGYETRKFNSNGLPVKITYGDVDTNPDNGNSAREVYLEYDSNFPAKLTEVRRRSDISAVASSCTETVKTGCQRTAYAWNLTGTLASVTDEGFTINGTGTVVSYSYTTSYTYETTTYLRPTQIDGPLAGSDDVTVFEYWSGSGDVLKDGFLQNLKRKRDASMYVVTSALKYDFWGNPTTLQAADSGGGVNGSLTCLTFSTSRGYLASSREAMAAQTDCTSTNAADLTRSWARDSALRLTQLTRPDGSCMFYEYDSKGRLLRTKRRDDCNAAAAGDKQEYVYDAEGLVTEIQTYDASNTLTAKQPYAYYDSRRLQSVINPVDTSKWTGITYDTRGLVSQVDAPSSLGKTVYHRDGGPGADGRVTSVDRYKDASLFDTWNLLYDWIGNQEKVTDGDAKATETVRDDLGRVVKIISPDIKYPVLRIYDAASRVSQVIESFGNPSGSMTHSFVYDKLGRQTGVDYAGFCPNDNGKAFDELTRQYDALSGVTCPAGMTCSRLGGKLAYVKISIGCSSAFHATDGSLDQETFYAYDDAGRMIREYIRDDAGRVADHVFTWTKNGALATSTMPSGAVIGATYGSAGSNSDTDLIAALWRTNTSSPVIESVQWNPYGPLKHYNQKNQIAGALQRTRIARNLAYRITSVNVEPQAGGTASFKVDIGEDAKGRVIKRDYTNAAAGVQDSYFLYDAQDRVICETDTLFTTCPTSGTGLKNNHSAGFTNAGDWTTLLRPIPGSTGFTNQFALASGTHQIASVTQSTGTPAYGVTEYLYDDRGNRYRDNNNSSTVLLHDTRDYTYDARGNVINVHGQYYTGSAWHDYDVVSMFDANNRRVSKLVVDGASLVKSQWFFYYDAVDRLVEIRYTPNIASPSTFTVFQLFWMGERVTAFWQTDLPSAATSKRYVGTDESGRPIDMWNWPTSGNASRVWAINPSVWGVDTNLIGPAIFQPILFAGQYQDSETVAFHDPTGSLIHRPAIVWNGFRSYDPFTGGYLQIDPIVDRTWSPYVYSNSDPVGHADATGLAVCTPENCSPWGDSGTGDLTYGSSGCGTLCSAACSVGAGWLFGCSCSECSPPPDPVGDCDAKGPNCWIDYDGIVGPKGGCACTGNSAGDTSGGSQIWPRCKVPINVSLTAADIRCLIVSPQSGDISVDDRMPHGGHGVQGHFPWTFGSTPTLCAPAGGGNECFTCVDDCHTSYSVEAGACSGLAAGSRCDKCLKDSLTARGICLSTCLDLICHAGPYKASTVPGAM